MNYEFYEFRNKPNPDIGPWLTYQVPNEFCVNYAWKLFFYTCLIPWIFGLTISAIGLLAYTLLFDYIYYRYLKSLTF